jgi:hypothetical protein
LTTINAVFFFEKEKKRKEKKHKLNDLVHEILKTSTPVFNSG